MASEEEHITTKIDELINLLLQKKRVELRLLAKQLNEKEAVLVEWLKTLEQEGLINIEYGLTKTYISIAKGAESKMLKKKTQNLEKVSASLLQKAEMVSKEAVSATKQLTELEQLAQKIEGILGTDTVNVDEVREKIDALKKEVDDYQNVVSETFDSMVQRAEELMRNVTFEYQKIADLIKDLEDKVNQKEFEKVKQELEQSTLKLKKIEEETKKIKKDLDSYEQLVNRLARQAEEIKSLRSALSLERFEQMGTLLIEAREVIVEYREVRDDIARYDSILSTKIAEADEKIMRLEALSDTLAEAYNKAAGIVGDETLKQISEYNFDDIYARSKSVRDELDTLVQHITELVSWLHSEELGEVLNSYGQQAGERNKIISSLKNTAEEVAEIKTQIRKVSDEVKIFKMKINGDMKDLLGELSDLAIVLDEYNKSVSEWKNLQEDYSTLKARINELIDLRKDIYSLVEKINKEISILYMQINTVSSTGKVYDEGAYVIDAAVAAAKDKKEPRALEEESVDKEELEEDIKRVKEMSDSYKKKREVIEQMLRELWEREKKAIEEKKRGSGEG